MHFKIKIPYSFIFSPILYFNHQAYESVGGIIMKPIIKTYLKTIAFIFISFLILSFLIALTQHFFLISNTIYSVLLYGTSYAIIVIASVYFSTHLTNKALWHLLAFALIYYLLSVLMNISHLQLFRQALKPLVFFTIGILTKTIFSKES